MVFKLHVDSDVELRLLRGDQSAMVYYEVERSRNHLREWMPWLDRTRSPRDTKPFLEQSWKGYQKGEGFSLGIFYETEFAGMIGFHAFDNLNRVTSLGYWLGQGFEGRGIMIRSVRKLLAYAFQERNMNRLYIRCASENLKSRAIPENLGFIHEGTQREAEWLYDHFVNLEIYALLAREWSLQQVPLRPSSV